MMLYKREYKIEINKIKRDYRIALISDLHDNIRNDDYNQMLDLTYDILNNKPDIICFAGDLVDDAKKTMDRNYDHILSWLNGLGQIAPVYIVKGNHDLFSYDEVNKEYDYFDSSKLFNDINDINDINNVNVLSGNKRFNYEELSVSGFDLDKYSVDYFEKYNESRKAFEFYLKPAISILDRSLDSNMFNILMIHSPKNLCRINYINYNLLLSGHMHNGILPNFLVHTMPLNIGIIDPTFKLSKLLKGIFPSHARGMYKVSDDTAGVIASPITTIVGHNDKRLIKTLYKTGIQYINIKSK